MSSKRLKILGLTIGAIIAVTYGAVVSADHSWGDYHWARTDPSFNLTIVNSTTTDWDSYVSTAVADWSGSQNVLNMVEDPTGSTDSTVRRKCSAPDGQVRICNLTYGFNGWLGIAGISIDTNGHIVRGYTKLNDSYFNAAYYNKDSWKQSVTCQELGHNVGLDHQDENFNNGSLFSCMDYQDPPFEHPNAHDYEQLETIYGQTDSYNSYLSSGGGGEEGGGCNAPPGKGCNKAGFGQDNNEQGWGASLGRRGNKEKFLRIDPDGMRHITFVTWVEHR
jgi:hypothetical protein